MQTEGRWMEVKDVFVCLLSAVLYFSFLSFTLTEQFRTLHQWH